MLRPVYLAEMYAGLEAINLIRPPIFNNIRSIEPEIIEFTKKKRLSVMGISDCRWKGTGTKQIHSDYVLTWSSVDTALKPIHDVGFILHPDTAKNVLETEYTSERIIKIRVHPSLRTLQ